MLTEKVGCILVTSHLQQFLEDYPPSSDKHAFLEVYHMLSLLAKYLYNNPKQHTHCMSSDNEYVTLLKYAIHLNIDLSRFLTPWAVLPILLDTQDGKHEYIKLLQEEYYTDKSRKYMVNLEKKSVEIQNRMHDSVTQNFDDELINGVNADTIICVDNIDNIEIVAENANNAPTNAEDIDTASINADNIVNVR